MDIIVFITTHNRSADLEKTFINLFSEKEFIAKHNIKFEVFDDNSIEVEALQNKAICLKYGASYTFSIIKYGRFNFWRIHNKFFKRLQGRKFDYVYSLQDDFTYTKNFFNTSINLFESLKKIDDKFVCFNLMDNRIGVKAWTPFEPVGIKVNDIAFYKTGWTDCVYLADKKFYDVLTYHLTPISRQRWVKNPKKSSGVGEQISKRLFQAGYSFYQLKNPLISHIGHISKMNRWRNKL